MGNDERENTLNQLLVEMDGNPRLSLSFVPTILLMLLFDIKALIPRAV